MKPQAEEYEAVNSQLAALKQITEGADWWTDLGAGSALVPPATESPALSCWPSAINTGADPRTGSADIAVTWEAVVPLTGPESVDALYVLADMRAALCASCGMSDPSEASSTFTLRDPGSNYASVTITVVTEFISTGRA